MAVINDNSTVDDEIRIGHILKHLMKEKKLTFKRLSELSGVPLSTIKTWSAGVEPKSVSAARKVSRALGVPVEYLLFGNVDKSEITFEEALTTQLFSGWCKVSIEIPVKSSIAKGKRPMED